MCPYDIVGDEQSVKKVWIWTAAPAPAGRSFFARRANELSEQKSVLFIYFGTKAVRRLEVMDLFMWVFIQCWRYYTRNNTCLKGFVTQNFFFSTLLFRLHHNDTAIMSQLHLDKELHFHDCTIMQICMPLENDIFYDRLQNWHLLGGGKKSGCKCQYFSHLWPRGNVFTHTICPCQFNCLPDKQSPARTLCSWTCPS